MKMVWVAGVDHMVCEMCLLGWAACTCDGPSFHTLKKHGLMMPPGNWPPDEGMVAYDKRAKEIQKKKIEYVKMWKAQRLMLDKEKKAKGR